MTALAAEGFIGRCGREATTAIRVVDVVFHVLVELFEEKGSLQPHLSDCAVETLDSEAGAVVVFFDVVDSPS